EVSAFADWALFERVAQRLQAGLQGQWIEQNDGPDQRYWDLKAAGGRVTLHLEHYLGITIYPTAGAAADDDSLRILTDAYDLLTKIVVVKPAVVADEWPATDHVTTRSPGTRSFSTAQGPAGVQSIEEVLQATLQRSS